MSNTYIIVDYESTCCDQNSVPRDEMEIIEIGAAAITEDEEDCFYDLFSGFIKPVRHPTLTEFCTSLTTITQEQVDNAKSFSEVNEEFIKWVNNYNNPVFCSWGYFDKRILLNNCKFHNVKYPFSNEHVNIKEEFAIKNGLPKGVGLGKALSIKNLKFIGTPHRGIDDVQNMVRLYDYIF